MIQFSSKPRPGKSMFMLLIHKPEGLVMAQCDAGVDDPHLAATQADTISKGTGYRVDSMSMVLLSSSTPAAIEVQL